MAELDGRELEVDPRVPGDRSDWWTLTWLVHLSGSPFWELSTFHDGLEDDVPVDPLRSSLVTLAAMRRGRWADGRELAAPIIRLCRLLAASPPPHVVPDDVVLCCDVAYPESLRQLASPPFGLWVRGDRGLLHAAPAVAIVGSRTPRSDSVAAARGIAVGLARQSVCIVSGLARGIDGEAHRGALAAGGSTIAVLGGGSDCVHPRQHRQLAADVVSNGGLLVSEHAPGDPARPWQFSRRNRIIAALADVTVVVQAMHGSGSMQTVAWAAALGRGVGAVPSWVGDPLYQGSLDLIRDGATVVLDASSLRGELPLADAGDAMDASSPWGAFLDQPRLPDELAGLHDSTLEQVLLELLDLEVNGVVMRLPDGRYRNARVHVADDRLP